MFSVGMEKENQTLAWKGSKFWPQYWHKQNPYKKCVVINLTRVDGTSKIRLRIRSIFNWNLIRLEVKCHHHENNFEVKQAGLSRGNSSGREFFSFVGSWQTDSKQELFSNGSKYVLFKGNLIIALRKIALFKPVIRRCSIKKLFWNIW